MPIPLLSALAPYIIPSRTTHFVQIGLFIFTIAVIRAYCQGRTTGRERDLHARVILLTGGFSAVGLTLIETLAKRGAKIIALSPDPIDAPQVELVIDALRTSTSNDLIHAEHCDLSSPSAIREFCTKFLTGQETRLDAILFAHEFEHIGSIWDKDVHIRAAEKRRTDASISTFLITTLLLPALLVAPPERDIRIINIVNPFYAAAVPSFSLTSPPGPSTFRREGYRSLRSAILMRHLQRVLDALPSAPAPDPESAAAHKTGKKAQKSNIVAITVSPGISRNGTVAPILQANNTHDGVSTIGFLIYLFLQPLLQIITKSPFYTIQSILHALFLPTPFKQAQLGQVEVPNDKDKDAAPIEILKPGALYSDCSVVQLRIPSQILPTGTLDKQKDGKDVVLDDGEMGGEDVGRLVWEGYEQQLKLWDKTQTSKDFNHSAKDK